MKGLAFALGLVVATGPASAQSVVGRAIVDGERVTLYSDRTWAPETTAAKGCRTVAPTVSFCGDPAVWESAPPPGPQIAVQYRYTDAQFAQIMTEGLGGNAGLNPKFMRNMILQNAAVATGVEVSDVTVVDVTPCAVGDVTGETVFYALDFQGVPVVYANCILIEPNRSYQVMTFELGPELTQSHRDVHATFLSLVKIEDAQ